MRRCSSGSLRGPLALALLPLKQPLALVELAAAVAERRTDGLGLALQAQRRQQAALHIAGAQVVGKPHRLAGDPARLEVGDNGADQGRALHQLALGLAQIVAHVPGQRLDQPARVGIGRRAGIEHVERQQPGLARARLPLRPALTSRLGGRWAARLARGYRASDGWLGYSCRI